MWRMRNTWVPSLARFFFFFHSLLMCVRCESTAHIQWVWQCRGTLEVVVGSALFLHPFRSTFLFFTNPNPIPNPVVPQAKLEEPLIVRPTSETVIWTMYRKWINSYRCSSRKKKTSDETVFMRKAACRRRSLCAAQQHLRCFLCFRFLDKVHDTADLYLFEVCVLILPAACGRSLQVAQQQCCFCVSFFFFLTRYKT